jgi:hypothetical protein
MLVTLGALPLRAGAEEPWYSVVRGDQRDWTLELSGGFTRLDVDGRGRLDDRVGDSKVSLDGTLDLSEIDSFWGELDLQLLEGQHLRFAYVPMRMDESAVLDTALVIDGDTYDAGDAVDSKLRFDRYELSYRPEFWVGELLSLAPVFQLTLADASVEIADRTNGLSAKESVLLPLPYVGGRVELLPLARLRLFGEFKGFTLGSLAGTWDVEGGASLQLTRNFALLGKYRASDYSVDYLDAEFDLRLAGPFVGASLRF